jgi:hypothetical protein
VSALGGVGGASLGALLLAAASVARAADADAERIASLERELEAARARVVELEATLAGLAADVAAIKRGAVEAPAPSPEAEPVDGRRAEVIVPDLFEDERGAELAARPELFVQAGYAAERIDGATRADAPTDFMLHRLEMRWSGRVAERLGAGVELQYHPAAEGASDELVNDAFIEYYAGDALTVRAGQFVKPFGFDIQHSSSARESPERAILAGYFFPGQRDRGVMAAADLSELARWLEGTSIYGGVFNGNRFFDDDNDSLNVNLRARKVFPLRPFALGASWQSGKQSTAAGTTEDATVYGLDAQWLLGRVGVRVEYARGDMPSTLLGREPEYTAGYAPGEKTWGAAAFFDYRFTGTDRVYWRWDRLDNDPVTRANVRAFNVGYLRDIGTASRLGIDYQWKDDVTFNDDELNTQLSIRWNLVY